jgi:isopentenyl phosphate kinase
VQQAKILKIGGSVLTRKDAPQPTLDADHLDRIIADIARWRDDDPHPHLIFVNGAGSFGHPLARKYELNAPHPDKDRLGFVRTTASMQTMATLIAAAFDRAGLPLFPVATSSIFETSAGRIVSAHLTPITRALDAGLIPHLWGDAVFDRVHTFRILSGDQINTYLAEHLGVSELLYGTDVDGIYTADPHQHADAARIETITDQNYAAIQEALSSSTHTDVTGGMQGKIGELYRTPQRPLRCVIYDATQPGRTYRALTGQPVGTRILFEAAPLSFG